MTSDDRRVERVADAVEQVRAGVDVDVQPRVQLAQLGQAREQPLAAEQRQHAEAQAQQLEVLGLRLDRLGQLLEMRGDDVVEVPALVGQLHRLVLAGEQLACR